jgi:hypothetical protein
MVSFGIYVYSFVTTLTSSVTKTRGGRRENGEKVDIRIKKGNKGK